MNFRIFSIQQPASSIQYLNRHSFSKSNFSPTFAPMLNRLKQKWKVNGWQLTIILVVFALGGSLCGWLGRKLLGLFDIDQTAFRITLYIVLVTLLWPFCVIIISIPFGQFPFFWNYLKKIFRRFGGGARNNHR